MGQGLGLLPFMIFVPPFLCISVMLYRLSCSQSQRAASISYVPPVHEQIANLPADEVLVRGSGEPAAPGELLRAAHDVVETQAEELLRPTE
jgi:hypothetical protein